MVRPSLYSICTTLDSRDQRVGILELPKKGADLTTHNLLPEGPIKQVYMVIYDQ